jgi:GTP-binding protein
MISVIISSNDSPLHGKEGDKITYSQIKDRLFKESENDVSLKIVVDPKKKDKIQVFGRGDLHLGILIEKLRREGFEMTLHPPQVIFKIEDGKKLEPIEDLNIEFEEKYLDVLIDMIQPRYGEIVETTDLNDNRIRVNLEIPTRGMFGLRTKLINLTKGHVIINSKLKGFEEHKGPIQRVSKGAIVSMIKGKSTIFALNSAENHGDLYIGPGAEVYEGMVIGELKQEGGEVEISPVRTKHLSNIRTTSTDENIKLAPVRTFTIEECMVMLRGDELLEVTPKNLRIRKAVLDNKIRRSMKKQGKISETL